MRINFKQLKKMTVETLSGAVLGKVHDLVFDVENQNVIQYIVKSRRISGEEYLIARDQVVKFEEKRMMVYDTAIKKKITSEKIVPVIPVVDASFMAQDSEI